jgi:hypothetical protein
MSATPEEQTAAFDALLAVARESLELADLLAHQTGGGSAAYDAAVAALDAAHPGWRTW